MNKKKVVCTYEEWYDLTREYLYECVRNRTDSERGRMDQIL